MGFRQFRGGFGCLRLGRFAFLGGGDEFLLHVGERFDLLVCSLQIPGKLGVLGLGGVAILRDLRELGLGFGQRGGFLLRFFEFRAQLLVAVERVGPFLGEFGRAFVNELPLFFGHFAVRLGVFERAAELFHLFFDRLDLGGGGLRFFLGLGFERFAGLFELGLQVGFAGLSPAQLGFGFGGVGLGLFADRCCCARSSILPRTPRRWRAGVAT